jgi:hypothetical protein
MEDTLNFYYFKWSDTLVKHSSLGTKPPFMS